MLSLRRTSWAVLTISVGCGGLSKCLHPIGLFAIDWLLTNREARVGSLYYLLHEEWPEPSNIHLGSLG